MPNPKVERATASWTTPYSDNVWSRLDELKSQVSVVKVDKEQQTDWVALGPTLHDDTESRLARVVVHRHREHGNGDARAPEIHWTLTVCPAPRTAPPDAVREYDAKLGGRLGLMKLLADAAPQFGAFRVELRVERADFQCKILPVHVKRGSEHDLAMNLGRSAWLEQVGYRFDGGASGLEEIAIVYLHEQELFEVHVFANGTLKLASPTWLPYADEIAELVLSTFFARGGQGTA